MIWFRPVDASDSGRVDVVADEGEASCSRADGAGRLGSTTRSSPTSRSSWFQPDRASTLSNRLRRTSCSFGGEDPLAEVGVSRRLDAFVDRPVEAEHAFVTDDAFALDHDVVAGFGVEILFFRTGEHDVVADDLRVEEQFGHVARDAVEASAAFDPVVTLVTHDHVNVVAAEDEVVARASERFRRHRRS